MNEIEENNKIIDRFLGKLYEGLCEYHRDWNLLMSVVEKIESLGYYTQISRSEDLNSCYIFENVPSYNRKEEDIICYTDFKYAKKIEAVWLAVIEFINWYNNNKQSSG